MKVIFSQLNFTSSSEKFANRKCGVSGLIHPRILSGSGSDRSVFVDVLKVIT
jgi:hypothetical protein